MLFPYKEKNTVNKLQFSVYCAASLIYLLRRQRDSVGLTLFSDKIEFQSDAKLSTVHAHMLYNELEGLLKWDVSKFNKKTNTAEAIHQIAENINKRSLVIIFSDMMESSDTEKLFSALQHLRYNKHEVVLFHVKDKKKEEFFEYNNRPLKFVDMETGEEIKLNPNDVREQYLKSVNDMFSSLKLKCGQFSIDFTEADINEDFRNVLLPFLIKRYKLF